MAFIKIALKLNPWQELPVFPLGKSSGFNKRDMQLKAIAY